MTKPVNECYVCGYDMHLNVEEFSTIGRVTSDCKPFRKGGTLSVCTKCGFIQKSPTMKWQEETTEIYNNYDIYHQSKNGEEKAVFDSVTGKQTLRSDQIICHLKDVIAKPSGDILDFGCGNGTFLKAWTRHHPQWKLHGFDLDDSKKAYLEQLNSFEQLYTQDISKIDRKFDLIVMIHSLEHIPEPKKFLSQMRHLLKEDGILFIQVPNSDVWELDYLVADHTSHFTLTSLERMVLSSGFDITVSSNQWLSKELSLAAKVRHELTSQDFPQTTNAEEIYKRVCTRISHLKDLSDDIKHCAAQRPFGVFGSSVFAAWIDGELDGKIDFFVDEDHNRVGNTFMGKPIVSPEETNKGETVYLPFQENISQQIVSRLKESQADFKYLTGEHQ